MPLVTWSKSPGDSPLHQRRVWLLAQQCCLTIATVSQQLSGPCSHWPHHLSALRLPKILLKAGISSHFQNTMILCSVITFWEIALVFQALCSTQHPAPTKLEGIQHMARQREQSIVQVLPEHKSFFR